MTNGTRQIGRGVPQGQRGFSLLEVLVALTIVCIALGILFQVVSGSLRLGFRARQHQAVWAEAVEAFERVLPAGFDWRDVEREGLEETSSWKIEVHPVALRPVLEAAGVASTRELFKVVFTYRDLPSNKTVRLASYRTVPADSLRDFLLANREMLVWDEHDRFLERIGR